MLCLLAIPLPYPKFKIRQHVRSNEMRSERLKHIISFVTSGLAAGGVRLCLTLFLIFIIHESCIRETRYRELSSDAKKDCVLHMVGNLCSDSALVHQHKGL
jgi:hypothetical protein